MSKLSKENEIIIENVRILLSDYIFIRILSRGNLLSY